MTKSECQINVRAKYMAEKVPPLNVGLLALSDCVLGFPPCSKCGRSENDHEYVTRLYCEKCGRVICRDCIDLGVFGSVSDMQSFIRMKSEPPYFYTEWDTCPYCQKMDWHKAHGG